MIEIPRITLPLIHDPLMLFGYGVGVGVLTGLWLGWILGRFLLRWI